MKISHSKFAESLKTHILEQIIPQLSGGAQFMAGMAVPLISADSLINALKNSEPLSSFYPMLETAEVICEDSVDVGMLNQMVTAGFNASPKFPIRLFNSTINLSKSDWDAFYSRLR